MTPEEIIYLVVGCMVFVALIAVIIVVIVNKKKLTKNATDKVVIKDGVRYTKDQNVVKDNGNMNITHNVGDVLLAPGKKYTATKTGKLQPGKYTVLSADGTAEKFNIRVSGFVREFEHNSKIVIAEGDAITAVSHTIILR